MTKLWNISETSFEPDRLNHNETVFTIGNGYLGTRGAFEEWYPGEQRTTFIHGVFDDAPVVFTELANAPDWTEMEILLAEERFTLTEGIILAYQRTLDLQTATLRRDIRWQSPRGLISHLVFERFASLDNIHLCSVRVLITPENYQGTIEIRSGLNGKADSQGFLHWDWLHQETSQSSALINCRTQTTNIELAIGFHQSLRSSSRSARSTPWDIHNHPSLVSKISAAQGELVTAQKWVTLYTSRDVKTPVNQNQKKIKQLSRLDWASAYAAHCAAWKKEWERCDIIIEGDEEAQLAVRFNIYHLLIAAPRTDEHVNIGAKTLSGYGYRGHAFWDTEIFMLPFFTYTRPEIARNLLSYRWHNLAGARTKARANGYKGAQFPWESAATGEEVTPTWVFHPKDRTKLIRIWTGDIEIHISADIAYAIWQYWQATHDDEFLAKRGAELIIETARFWASRVEWQENMQRYEINDIIGPDENHDHVNNNVYTNAMARWNLQTAIEIIGWMKKNQSRVWKRLSQSIQFKEKELSSWNHIIEHIYLPYDEKSRLIEQFNDYFSRNDVDLAAMEPRTESIQSILGIAGANATQVLKQPDVLMLMYLLPELYDQETIQANYDYYTPRTDHTFGSSLGPSIQAIMACRVGDPSAYEHFLRAARADLVDVRNNASDGIHGASAGGLWQAVVFGFAGLRLSREGWQVHPVLPKTWTRLAFQIVSDGRTQKFDIHA
ncbi:MAG TPA: glycoside hydrolase family 65 protein [Bellilinea sp.]|nr:glycoside hydrolase family 65 protein [Bellilinea sp.]